MKMFRVASFATLVLALLAAPGADATFHVEKANVVVRLPAEIAGSYEMAISNFGSPIYGATLSCVPARFAIPRVSCAQISTRRSSIAFPDLASASPTDSSRVKHDV